MPSRAKGDHACPLCGTALPAITMEALGKHFMTCRETEWAANGQRAGPGKGRAGDRKA